MGMAVIGKLDHLPLLNYVPTTAAALIELMQGGSLIALG
jgi:hypothetical protein